MKYIQPMNCNEFAKFLLTLKTGDTIEFACEPGVDYPNEMPELEDVERWYFAKVMEIKEYDSRFILIDYAGGEEAFAIPLNNYKNCCDEDDEQIVPDFVKKYFKYNWSIDDVVFVEMEEVI